MSDTSHKSAEREVCPICGEQPASLVPIKGPQPGAKPVDFGRCGKCYCIWAIAMPGECYDYEDDAYNRSVTAQGARLWSYGYFEGLLRRFAGRARSVVECGAGPGWLGVAAAQRGVSYVGYEVSERYARIAADALGVEVRNCDFLTAEGSYDAVVMLQLVEHVWDPLAFFRKAAQLAKPGGAVIVATPNLLPADLLLQWNRRLGRGTPRLDAFKPSAHFNVLHPRTFATIERDLNLRRVALTNNPHGLRSRGLRGRLRTILRTVVAPAAWVGIPLDVNLLWVGRKPD